MLELGRSQMAKGLTRLLNRAADRTNASLIEAGSAKAKAPQSPPDNSRHMLRLIRQAQEAERRRVARELHDSVNQILSSVQFRLQAMEEKLSSQDESTWREALKAKALLEKAMQEVRRISHNLRPSELDDLGLEAALRSLCREFADRTGIAVSVTLAALPKNLGGEVELNLYRIIQEALTNIEKHAGARKVEVLLVHTASYLETTIRDDGRGFDPDLNQPKPNKTGMGFVDMRERAASLGGTCIWQSAPREGTQIILRVPLEFSGVADEERKAEKNSVAAH